jgi:hypothetical protein
MWISELQVLNIKSFADSGFLQLSRGINVIVGKNNAGKSTLLQSVLCMQSTNQQHPFMQFNEATRIGTSEATINIHLQDVKAIYFGTKGISDGAQGYLTISFSSTSQSLALTFTSEEDWGRSLITITDGIDVDIWNPYTIERITHLNPDMYSNRSPNWQKKFNHLHNLLIHCTDSLTNYVKVLLVPP